MIIQTKRSFYINSLLESMRSPYRHIGIIGTHWFGISCKGTISRFKLRPNWQFDLRFPGDIKTQKHIAAKQMIKIFELYKVF